MPDTFQVYFTRLFFVCAAVILCELIASHTRSPSGTQSALKFICALALFICLASAVGSGDLMKTLSSLTVTFEEAEATSLDNTGTNALLENTKNVLKEKIRKEIFTLYGINTTDICIQLDVKETADGSDVDITFVGITLPKGCRSEEQSAVGSYITGVFGTIATVKVG